MVDGYQLASSDSLPYIAIKHTTRIATMTKPPADFDDRQNQAWHGELPPMACSGFLRRAVV
ncbi:MAG: hypothetical protein DHS20C11_07330 [Lysobacteraceae bacterium]|nr:MAG: hypothetical protein DHS20C11_07330 [Xanthomonadaceae bacterium]